MPQKISSSLVRICKGCGREFHPHARKQFYCNQEIDKVCSYCGKTFKTVCSPYTKITCSPNCQANYIKSKRKLSAKKETRICKWCGKEFHPNSVRDIYCYDKHYQKCVVCGELFEIDPRKNKDTRTCSTKCKNILALRNRDTESEQEHLKKTMMMKYGVFNPMQLPGSVDKIRQTNVERYGSEWYTQTEEYKIRSKNTSLSKYGVDHHLKSDDVIAKRQATVLQRYGVDNVFQSEYIKSISRDTLVRKFGVTNVSQSRDIQDKIAETNMKKYGVKHPMMLKEYQDKASKTNLERYGRSAYTQRHIENIKDWYLFINDSRSFINSRYETTPRSAELAEYLGVDVSTIDIYLSKNDCKDCVRRAKSLMEEDVKHFISTLDSNIRVEGDDRSVIAPKELDIYLPDFNIAFECNPTVTHNSTSGDPWGSIPKHYRYHLDKTISCEDAGIFLFHIFGSEWTYSRPIIESMIRNLLGKSGRKIYARNCEVRDVDWNTCRDFLNTNHRQGNANSKIRLGLYLEDELVSVMTFGKMRNTIGTDGTDLSDCWELVRFCSLLNTSVVGGASKLFKYFIKKYNPVRVRSFSDRAHTRGGLYEKLGFRKLNESTPGYVWVDSRTDISYHRYSAQKQNIKKFLHDDNIDLSKTEKQIMEEHGFLQVFDCGTILWEYVNS